MTAAAREEFPVPATPVLDADDRPRARSAAVLAAILFVGFVACASVPAMVAHPRPTLGATPNVPVERTVKLDLAPIIVEAARAPNMPHTDAISDP